MINLLLLKRKHVYIPFEYYQGIGGPSTFMRNLKNYLDLRKFKYKSEMSSTGSIFFPISFNLDELERIKTTGGEIIQRLDGIYYPSKHGDAYLEYNKNIKDIYSNYTDYVIFQSNYSYKQCFEMFGGKKNSQFSIIHNGVNCNIFYPVKDRTRCSKIINFITTGNFRNIDMIEPVIKALDELRSKFNFRFHLVGPIASDSLEHFFNREYIVYHGSKNMSEVADFLRESDIFVYSHLNPPCPNSVLEAVATGLPVVGFDSGAMSELCFFNNDLLAYVSDDIFQKYEDFIPGKLAEKIQTCVENYEYYRKRSLDHAHLYSFEDCGAKYVDVFNKVLQK